MSAEGKVKSIFVKIEDTETGEVIKVFDCGTDERRADKLEDSIMDRADLDKYHVYTEVEKE